MDNNQYTSIVESANENAANAPKEKSKLKMIIIIAIVAVLVIVGIVVAVVMLSKGSGGNEKKDGTALVKDNDTLQIYAELDEEIPLESIDSVVKNINAGASVSLDDGYGTIKMSDSKGEFISFYYETEENEVDDSISEQHSNDPATIDDKTYGPDIAYGFTYVLPLDDENSMTVSCDNSCYFYDGGETHEYDNKEEAIKAYLAYSEEQHR